MKKLIVCVLILLGSVSALFIGDAVYDGDAHIRALNFCGDAQVKTVSTKGLFVTEIDCKAY